MLKSFLEGKKNMTQLKQDQIIDPETEASS